MIGILLDRSTRGLNRNRAVRGADPRCNRRDLCDPCRRERRPRPVNTIAGQIQSQAAAVTARNHRALTVDRLPQDSLGKSFGQVSEQIRGEAIPRPIDV